MSCVGLLDLGMMELGHGWKVVAVASGTILMWWWVSMSPSSRYSILALFVVGEIVKGSATWPVMGAEAESSLVPEIAGGAGTSAWF